MSIPAPYLSPFPRVPSRRGVRSCSIRARHRRPDRPILDRPNSMLAFALTDASLPTLIRDRVSRYKARFNWDHYPHPMIPGARESLPDETHGCASVTSAFLQVRIAPPTARSHTRVFSRPNLAVLPGPPAFLPDGREEPRRRPRRETRASIQLGSDHTPRSARSLPDTPNSNPRGRSTRVRSHIRAPRRRCARAPDEHRAQRTRSAVCNNTRNQHPLHFFFVCEG